MSLTYLGPIVLALHGDPDFSWSSAPSPSGSRRASIRGRIEWKDAKQLSELVANSDRRVTIGDATGVLEYVYAGDDLLRTFNGWYLLQSCDLAGEQPSSITGVIGFSLAATYLGAHREAVVARSDRRRPNDFELAGQALVANPYWGEDDSGQPFVVDPGGSFFTREYDPTSPHDGVRLTATNGSRQVGLYAGDIGELAVVVLPDLAEAVGADNDGVPRWVTDRGGECRAFDRREEREVFGPSHPLAASTDLIITNGLVRAWVGARGLPPYLQMQAFAGGQWREVGFVSLADPSSEATVLTSARLTRVTPEVATVAIGIQSQGEAFVSLRRGGRGLDIQHGGSNRPRIAANRRVFWTGLPPWTRLVSAANGTGKFGQGIEGGRDDATWDSDLATWDDPGYSWDGSWRNPDVRLRWPPPARKSAWTKCWWYRPTRAAADLAGAGLLTIFDSAGAVAGRVDLDADDERFKFTLGANTVESSVQTFAASDDVFVCLRFSDDDGMALSIKAGAADIEHAKNAAALDPGTTGTFLDVFFGTSDATWGSGNWGDGNWGGVSWADGVMDNLMIFDGYLSDAEVAALAGATSRLEGLPDPEAKLVWHLPGDPRVMPARSAQVSGRVYEATTEGGSTRLPDDWGLTKALGLLDGDAGAVSDFSVVGYAEVLEVSAYLATTATHDDLADHHEQFAAATEQEVRVR